MEVLHRLHGHKDSTSILIAKPGYRVFICTLGNEKQGIVGKALSSIEDFLLFHPGLLVQLIDYL